MRQILNAEGDFEVTGEASSYPEVMQLMRRDGCDVLILDVAMPGKNGIDTLKQLKQEWPKLPGADPVDVSGGPVRVPCAEGGRFRAT